jgi:thioredoxin 1
MDTPLHVTDDAFEKTILQAELPVLVDFWAEWCGPCKMIGPYVAELAKEYDGKAIVAKVDTDANPLWASRFGIMGIPTLIVFNGGKEVDRVEGAVRKDELKSKLEKVLAAAAAAPVTAATPAAAAVTPAPATAATPAAAIAATPAAAPAAGTPASGAPSANQTASSTTAPKTAA